MQPGTFLFSPCRCRSRSILFCTLYPVWHNGIIQEDYFVEQTMVFSQFKKQFNISLNEQQEAAVQATEGPVMLLAVPGSGKTTVLVTRLGYMCLGLGIAPESILTMTYTVAAAGDMRQRFAAQDASKLQTKMRLKQETKNAIIQYSRDFIASSLIITAA